MKLPINVQGRAKGGHASQSHDADLPAPNGVGGGVDGEPGSVGLGRGAIPAGQLQLQSAAVESNLGI